MRQSANLWALKQCMHRHWVRRLGACRRAVHSVDGFPVSVCHFRRAHFSQVFRAEATFGYCASKQQTYYGLKAMLLTSDEGVIKDIALFAANVDERDALVDMDLARIKGTLLGDKGFIRPILKEDLASQGIDLHTLLRSNMKESRPRSFMRWAAGTRRLVETVIGQLCERFDKLDPVHLWSLYARKCFGFLLALGQSYELLLPKSSRP